MLLDGLQPIGTAGGSEATTRPDHGGNEAAIKADQGQHQPSQAAVDAAAHR